MNDDVAQRKLGSFSHDLTAPAAGSHWRRTADRPFVEPTADDCDFADLAQLALCIERGQRHDFGTERKALARIFEIAACDDRSIVEQDGRSDAKP